MGLWLQRTKEKLQRPGRPRGREGGRGRPPEGARVSDTLHTQPSHRCFLCVSSFIPIIPVLHGNHMLLL